uniref:Roadblock/LAMTOR2 domain-containing protein n=1 Tax=Sexangularia sp. CB-2014 TaxID=1486929 RepID=A0A7S1YAW1_9EUKA
MSDLQSYLDSLLRRIPGLKAITVCDRDGVIVLSSPAPVVAVDSEGGEAVLSEEQQRLQSQLAVSSSSFVLSSDQLEKVALGSARTLVTSHEGRSIAPTRVYLSLTPLVVGLAGTAQVNVGMLLALTNDLSAALAPLRSTLAQTPH